ncbi:MAG: ATP-binding protein [Polyangiales bacterium]
MTDPLVDDLPAGVLVHRGGVITAVNASLCAIMGLAPAAIIGRRITDFLSEDEGRRVLDRYEKRRSGGYAPDEYECSVTRPDGDRRVLALTVALRGEDVVVVARDATEQAGRRLRTVAMAHLGVSIQHQRSEAGVLKALRDGLGQVGLTAALLEAEEAGPRVRFIDLPPGAVRRFEDAVGVRVEGMVGRWTPTLREALAWGEAYTDDALNELGDFVGGGAGDLARVTAARAGRRYRGAAVRMEAGARRSILVVLGDWLREDDRPVVQLLGAQVSAALDNARVLDLSRRRERDLAAVNALARRMLCGAPEPAPALIDAACAAVTRALGARVTDALLVERDERGALRVRRASGGEALTVEPGSLLEEALRQPGVVVVGDTSTDPRAVALQAFAPGEAMLLVPMEQRDGPQGLLAVRDAPTRRFDDDEVALATAMATVVQVGVENARLYDELRRRVGELTEAQAKLVQGERLAAIGELAAVMAHEVRNPLAVLSTSLVVIGRAVDDEADDARAALGIMREEIDRLARIVAELLDFARPLQLRPKPTGARALLDEALTVAAASAGAAWARVRPSVTVVPESLRVSVDAPVFRQALVNVVLNAVQAMPQGGALTLRAARDAGGAVSVSVEDTGEGITGESLARVFEPFFTTKATGTGLGLAVTRRVLEAHEGSVDVESVVGRGTTVTMRVPEAAGP